MAVSVSVSAPSMATKGKPFTATVTVSNDTTTGDKLVIAFNATVLVLRPASKLPAAFPIFLGGSAPTASMAPAAMFSDVRQFSLIAGTNKTIEPKFIIHAPGDYLVTTEVTTYPDATVVPPAYAAVQVT